MARLNISLVFPPYYLPELYNLPPLGLIGLASNLKDTSHKVRIHDHVLALRQGALPLDDNLYQACAREVLEGEPDLVAFSIQCTTSVPALRVAQKIKQEKPEARILFGGHGTSVLDMRLLQNFPFLDLIARGEGEITFKELVQDLANGGDGTGVSGVSCRQGDNLYRNPDRPFLADLDELPRLDYGFVPPLHQYKESCSLSRAIAVLEVGRGCPHKCIYCSQSVLWKRKPRTFSPRRIVREMAHLRDDLGAECFLLAYDQFTAKRDFVIDFCEQVIRKGLANTPWYCISRLDTVDPDLLSLMREAGCESMCYGIDSGSSRTLKFINKRIDQEQLFQRVRETADQGIVSTLSFVIGFPEEELEDIDQTLLLALQTGAYGNCDPLLQLPTVLPGTGLYEQYQDGFVRKVDTYFSLGLEFGEGKRFLSDDRMIDSDPLVFSCFHNIPCPGLPPQELEILASNFPLVIRHFPRTFLLLVHALDQSPSKLFLHFFSAADADRGLEEDDFLNRFPVFAAKQIVRNKTEWDHLHDVIGYESAGAAVLQDSIRADSGGIGTNRPLLKKDILLREFNYPIPSILQDIRKGSVQKSYRPDPVWLLFSRSANGIEVTEINEFGKDFLGLCDGTRSIPEIARELRSKYGRDMDPGVFLNVCREAEGGLKDGRILETAGV
ncbi:MAG: B12-binding domain-containing radical SAM protein [Desulfovibrionales bacterium]